jgi:hypothetical protein
VTGWHVRVRDAPFANLHLTSPNKALRFGDEAHNWVARAEGYAVAAGVGCLGTRGRRRWRIIGKEQEAETAKLAGMAEWLNGSNA